MCSWQLMSVTGHGSRNQAWPEQVFSAGSQSGAVATMQAAQPGWVATLGNLMSAEPLGTTTWPLAHRIGSFSLISCSQVRLVKSLKLEEGPPNHH